MYYFNLIFRPRAPAANFKRKRASFLPFERKRKRKRQRGHFPSCPLCKPQNSSYPHKRKAGKRGMFAPLSKGGKREPSASGYMRWEQVHTKRRGGDGELSGAVLQLRRGAGNRSARVFIILFFVVVKGAKNFAGNSLQIFPAQFLDKTGAWKKTPDKSAAPARVCSRGRRLSGEILKAGGEGRRVKMRVFRVPSGVFRA